MAKVPIIITVTDLRQDTAAALKRLKTSKEPVVITQRGRATAVLLSLEEYQRGERERQLLRRIARGEKKIAACKHITGDREITRNPVIEIYKKDIDRTLLIENLRRTVSERMANLVAMQRLAVEARKTVKKRS